MATRNLRTTNLMKRRISSESKMIEMILFVIGSSFEIGGLMILIVNDLRRVIYK